MIKKLTMGSLFLAMISGISVPAHAQQSVINLDETVIQGRYEKPEAFYILQHAKLSYEKLQPKQSFIPELLETVDEKPF